MIFVRSLESIACHLDSGVFGEGHFALISHRVGLPRGYPENLERACSRADGGGKPDPTDRYKDWGDTLGRAQTRSFPLFSLGFGLFGGLESGCVPILLQGWIGFRPILKAGS